MANKKRTKVLMIFARLPVEGKVKTRLIPAFGEKITTKLYLYLAEYTFKLCHDSSFDCIQIWLSEHDPKNPYVEKWQISYPFSIHIQQGNDLGERMYSAFRYSLLHFDSAVIIGCDCPDLNFHDLNLAGDWLADPNNNVIGPTEDGGYYLLGLNDCCSDLFEGIPWGQKNVADCTRHKAKKLNLRLVQLDEKWDIDWPKDVCRLLKYRPDFFANNHEIYNDLIKNCIQS